jgi:hypothetical protein
MYDAMSNTHALPTFAAQSTYCVLRICLSALNSLIASLLRSLFASLILSLPLSLFGAARLAGLTPQGTETLRKSPPRKRTA